MKRLQGTITHLNTANTAKVSVVRQWQHPLYKKSVKRSKNYACHYTTDDYVVGDQVIISECVPKSKTKRFEIITKVGGAQ